MPGLKQKPNLSDQLRRVADRALVDRCVAGDVSAWTELYDQCHESLMAAISYALRPIQADPNVAEEIAARVWYNLVSNDAELLDKYDPNRGARLDTYMRVLASDEIRRHFRSEKRRRNREIVASELGRSSDDNADFIFSMMDEFEAALTPSEKRFYQMHLLQNGGDPALSYSSTNMWQLTHRIRVKLRSFILGD